MRLHITDPKSSPAKLEVTNPGYISPEKLAMYRSLEAEGKLWGVLFVDSVDELIADSEIVWGGDYSKLTMLIDIHSRAYCGETLLRKAKPAPELLYEAINYTLACSLLDHPEEQLCFNCIGHLDKIRDKEGYRPILDYLRDPDSCCCASWVLQRNGCQCWARKIK